MEKEQYERYTVGELRSVLFELGGAPGNKKKEVLIEEILKISSGEITPSRSNRGRPASRTKRMTEPYESISTNSPLSDFKSKSFSVAGLYKPAKNGGYLMTEGYSSSDSDLFVPPKVAEESHLRYGDYVEGDGTKQSAKSELTFVRSVNGKPPKTSSPEKFESKEILPIGDRIVFGCDDAELKTLETFCPLAKGQRSITIAPPNSGKTTLYKNIARAVSNDGKIKVMLLLLDQRPEDIAFVKAETLGMEFIATSFSEPFFKHVEVAETAFNRAKAIAEDGEDVLLLIDSASRLVKAYKNLNGEDLQTAILRVKKLLSLARRVEGGSFTILAGADKTLYEEDAIICEELASVSNSIIYLDGNLAANRVFPAINLLRSACKNYRTLLSESELTVYDLANRILAVNPSSMERILKLCLKHIFDGKLIEKLNEIYLAECR